MSPYDAVQHHAEHVETEHWGRVAVYMNTSVRVVVSGERPSPPNTPLHQHDAHIQPRPRALDSCCAWQDKARRFKIPPHTESVLRPQCFHNRLASLPELDRRLEEGCTLDEAKQGDWLCGCASWRDPPLQIEVWLIIRIRIVGGGGLLLLLAPEARQVILRRTALQLCLSHTCFKPIWNNPAIAVKRRTNNCACGGGTSMASDKPSGSKTTRNIR